MQHFPPRMAATTQKCRVLEKNKYWKEFESNRHQFFKILVGDFRNHLRVPKKFTENFREKLLGTIHRRGPSGFMWTVEVEKMFNHVVFQNGWPTFVEEHRLEKADLLVFRYIGNSAFNVVIFDSSGCVREGSYFVREHTNACSNDGCVLDKEDGEDCEDIIDLEKPHIQKRKIKKGRGRPSSKAVDADNRHQSKAREDKQPRAQKLANLLSRGKY
ncbi:B3 domain-containing protein Os03g0622200 isoform X1 [Gossypium hirsutum]|uniref:B3 domain-containing protein Os03g0622200 isoform X1 n=2 Tax=Gossypium hirsutum TaxID=3635 RepID=A0A1U8K3N5_GOSHI|nr:B3 domain-containing protein Os03g0622200 isoform X1 [Gossypium hirsutum]